MEMENRLSDAYRNFVAEVADVDVKHVRPIDLFHRMCINLAFQLTEVESGRSLKTALITRRFGLDGSSSMTLDEMEVAFGIDRDVMGSAITSVILRMRSYPYACFFAGLVMTKSPELAFANREDDVERLPDLTTRVRCFLKNHDIEKISALVKMTDSDLLKKKGFGRKSLKILDDSLAQLGYERKG